MTNKTIYYKENKTYQVTKKSAESTKALQIYLPLYSSFHTSIHTQEKKGTTLLHFTLQITNEVHNKVDKKLTRITRRQLGLLWHVRQK